MAGKLFTIVGPSGVGKDTLLDAALKECPNVKRIRRVVTRPASSGGEDIHSVTDNQFDQMKDRGDFALSWSAHGLSYGIPKEINQMLASGDTVVFNGSRSILNSAMEIYPALTIISIEADIGILRYRLIARARESVEQIENRLVRAQNYRPTGPNVVRITNNGSLEEAVAELSAIFMHPVQSVQ